MNRKYQSYTDAQLAPLLNHRDVAAYTEVYERYWAFLYNHARRMTKDDDLAQDILQDTFLVIYNKMGETDFSKITLPTYLFTIVKNFVLMGSNRGKLMDKYISYLSSQGQPKDFSTEDYVREREIQQLIDFEINALHAKMRRMYELSRQHYLSYEQIAQETGTSVGNVKKQIHNALKVLRAKLTCMIFLHVMTLIWWLYKQ